MRLQLARIRNFTFPGNRNGTLPVASQSGHLIVSHADPKEADGWDEFVEGHPEGRFCHLWAFRRVLENTYGYRCVYLNIFSGGERVGVFPSVALPRGGGRLISQPFNEYGGPLTLALLPEQFTELTHGLLGVAEQENCRAIEIRGGVGLEPTHENLSWTKRSLYSYATLALDERERLWRNSLTNEARKCVNQATKAGLTVDVRRAFDAVDDPFRALYLMTMKRLGIPPHSRRFFLECAAAFGSRLVAAWVMQQGRPASILLGILTGQRIHIFVTASDPRFWPARANDLAHWELINWAFASGMRTFDFGSARYPGQIHFKKKWGVSFHEYCCYLVAASNRLTRMKLQTVDSSSSSMVMLANIWRWLMPIPLTPLLGPPIRKYLTK